MEGGIVGDFWGIGSLITPAPGRGGGENQKTTNLILHDFDSLPDSKQRQGCSVAIRDHPVETI